MKPAEIKELTELLVDLQQTARDACETVVQTKVETLIDKMRLTFVEQAVVEIMSNDYDFGKVTSVTRFVGGLINQNFSVTTNDGIRCHRLFVKRYRREATVKEILFEHKCNEYLTGNDLTEIAQLIKAKDGRTFVEHQVKHLDPPDRPSKFAVYTYLEGEDRYTWLTPHCSTSDMASASAMFAKIHECGFGFDAGEHVKEEPGIIPLMDVFRKYFTDLEEKIQTEKKEGKSVAYFLENLPSYHRSLDLCQLLKEKCNGMLKVMIHGDYHPGNQKYTDSGVTGIFDFDWCKQDLRLFDVAISITYFCTSWKEHENGQLFLDEIEVFLEAYQERLADSDRIFPLTKQELSVLPEMILMANMYVIWWDLQEIFDNEQSESNEDECMIYLSHNTKLNEFALKHLEEIRTVINNIST